MGLRFRKSVGSGPFRATVSKTGVSASVGGKGYRVTKRADGRTQHTASVPGTGISYVKTSGSSNDAEDQWIDGKEFAEDDGPLYNELPQLEQLQIDHQRISTNLSGLQIAVPVLCVILLFLSILSPWVLLAVALVCLWWRRWQPTAVRQLAEIAYKEACLNQGGQPKASPADSDLEKWMRPLKKPFYLRWWFVLLAALFIGCQIILLIP